MSIIQKPYITEKTMKLVSDGLYTFIVSRDATKEAIAKLIKTKFSVEVLAVKTANFKSKTKMQRTRKGYFSTQAYKKAFVQVKKGQKIALFESAIAQPEEQVQVTTAEGEPVTTIKEKKSLLRGTKVKVEKAANEKKQTKKGDK